jgi:hypothetical protein
VENSARAGSEIALDVFQAFVGSEAGAGEAGFTRLAHDAVGADLDFGIGQVIAAGRGSGGGHAVGGKERFPFGFGAKEIFQNRRREVDPVWDEESHKFVPSEEALNDIVMAVEHLGHTISQVCAESCAGLDGGVDLRVRGSRVAEGDQHTLRDEMFDHIRRAGPFGCECDEADVSVCSFLEGVEIGDARGQHPPFLVGSTKAGLRGNPWPLEVVAAGGLGNSTGSGAEAFQVFELEAKRFDVVGDESRKKPERAVSREGGHGVLHPFSGEAWILKIHTRESIHLDVEQALHISDAEDLSRKHQQVGCV